jgi:hypothetical protein
LLGPIEFGSSMITRRPTAGGTLGYARLIFVGVDRGMMNDLFELPRNPRATITVFKQGSSRGAAAFRLARHRSLPTARRSGPWGCPTLPGVSLRRPGLFSVTPAGLARGCTAGRARSGLRRTGSFRVAPNGRVQGCTGQAWVHAVGVWGADGGSFAEPGRD